MSHDVSALIALALVLLISGCGLAVVFRNAARRRQKDPNMGLLTPTKDRQSETVDGASPVPVAPFDVSRRYDIYCSPIGDTRVYENVRLTGIRTFDRITQFSSGALGGLLEIEAANGTRLLIPQHGIQMICEHGAQPVYRVLSRWTPPDDDDSWRKDS